MLEVTQKVRGRAEIPIRDSWVPEPGSSPQGRPHRRLWGGSEGNAGPQGSLVEEAMTKPSLEGPNVPLDFLCPCHLWHLGCAWVRQDARGDKKTGGQDIHRDVPGL